MTNVAHSTLSGSDLHAPGAHNHAASEITSGVIAIARLATGTPDGTKFIRDDGALAVPSGSSTVIPHIPSGRYATIGRRSGLFAAASAAVVANTMYGLPIFMLAGEVVTAVGVNCVSGQTGNVHAAIYLYDPTTGFGTTRLAVDGGGQAVVSGANDIPVSYTIPNDGFYVPAVVFDGTPTMTTVATAGYAPRGATVMSAIGTAGMSRSFTYATPPNPAAFTTEVNSQISIGLKI